MKKLPQKGRFAATLLSAGLLLGAVPALLAADTPEQTAASASLAPPAGLTAGTQDVIRLYQNGLPPDELGSFVQAQTSRFRLTADQIIYLHKLGLLSETVTAMLRRDAELNSAPATAGQRLNSSSRTAYAAPPSPPSPATAQLAQPVDYPPATVVEYASPYYGYGDYNGACYPAYYYPAYGYPAYSYSRYWGRHCIGFGFGAYGYGRCGRIGYEGYHGRGFYAGGFRGGTGGFGAGTRVNSFSGGFHGGGRSAGFRGSGSSGGFRGSAGAGGHGGGHR